MRALLLVLLHHETTKAEGMLSILFYTGHRWSLLDFTDISTLEIKWEAGDEEQDSVQSNEAGEEKVHGVPKTNCVADLLNQNSKSS